MRHRSGARWVPVWTVTAAMVGTILNHPRSPIDWWFALVLAALVLIGVIGVTFGADRVATAPHRILATAGGGGWTALVAYSGWTQARAGVLLVGTVTVAVLEWLMPAPAPTESAPPAEADPVDSRPPGVQAWEALLNRLIRQQQQQQKKPSVKQPVRVTAVQRWPSGDGEQVRVDLPEDMTAAELAGFCAKLASARRLPHGCIVRVLDGAHQGEAILDVMLRDCLADPRTIDEPTSKASINDEMDVATAPRGEPLTVCLRQKSMMVGGTTGSGKTTLLHRIIMFLARCTDTLIWVIDLNGGGVAAPWIVPWAHGRAPVPVVDWVADNDAEAAVMIAVAAAIAKDRKTNNRARLRKTDANSTVLPVGPDMPAIVIITDEAGEIRQKAGLMAALVDSGIARVAQIARAEGVRLVLSVLRGTGDLVEKGYRAVAGIRVCLRMDEEGEYDHVLGVNPGRTRLLHVGSAYVYRTDTDHRPVLARTVNVLLDQIDAHAVATATLRPELDEHGRRVAARVTVRQVLDGRDPLEHRDIARLPVMRDVADGRAYEGRWARQAAMLAELRGEEPPADDRPAEPAPPAQPTVAPPGSVAEQFLMETGVLADPGRAERVPAGRTTTSPDNADVAAVLLSDEHLARTGVNPADRPAAEPTTRDLIMTVLREAAEPLTLAQVCARLVECGHEVSKPRVHKLLGELVQNGQAVKEGQSYTAE